MFSIGFLICLIANTLVALSVNRWSKSFFDALQLHDRAALFQCIVQLAVLGALTVCVAIMTLQSRMRLQLNWRLWLTNSLVERWRKKDATREGAISRSIDNPEARIAEDGRLSVELFVDLAGGIINIFLISSSFIVVLWPVSYTHL
ncbi:MAG: ABC transporter ATP-binding protein/permease, partial [Methylocystis sp.]|nr:ABC transporter ATP-binding protein/permease [Methylocystis sp.]